MNKQQILEALRQLKHYAYLMQLACDDLIEEVKDRHGVQFIDCRLEGIKITIIRLENQLNKED